MNVITNNVPRNLIYGCELTEEEREDFDYLDDSEIDSHEFFRYKGVAYDPNEFTRCNNPDWAGVQSNSYFSGIVVRYTEDYEQIIVGRYYS